MVRQLSESAFWILAVLASGRQHGYGITVEAAQASEGRVGLKVATLYTALDRLADQGLVQVDGDEVVDGRFRRYFCLTGAGAARLADETARLEANARQARARLRARGI